MSIFGFTDYRAYLKATYVEKTRKNPGLSLRAFAKHLALSPAALSRILKGDKNLSVERAAQVAQKMRLEARELDYFCLLVQLAQTKNAQVKTSILDRINSARPNGSGEKVYDLSVDYFQVISEWYHFAILEMTQLPGLKFAPEPIAKYLGIKPVEAEVAIERLKRLELLEVHPDGSAGRPAGNRLLVSSAVQHEALRKYYRELLAKASDSLESQTPKERVSAAETLLVDPTQVDQLRRLTDQYLDQVIELARQSKNRTDVYQISLHIFRLNPVSNPRGESHV